jgi:hypothetical protein
MLTLLCQSFDTNIIQEHVQIELYSENQHWFPLQIAETPWYTVYGIRYTVYSLAEAETPWYTVYGILIRLKPRGRRYTTTH